MMERFLITVIAATMAACANPSPTAPTVGSAGVPHRGAPGSQLTSRVNPEDLDTDELLGLTLDHDPFAPGIEMCRTKLRGYQGANGYTSWEIDYYTVAAPETCPAEPID